MVADGGRLGQVQNGRCDVFRRMWVISAHLQREQEEALGLAEGWQPTNLLNTYVLIER